MNSLNGLTPEALRRAADIQEHILELQGQLARILGGAAPAKSATAVVAKKRRLSAQGLANIRAGALRRWAKQKKGGRVAAGAARPKRKMSPAGRRRIRAALKARWAAAKAAGRNAL
jgi:hypothetical protein